MVAFALPWHVLDNAVFGIDLHFGRIGGIAHAFAVTRRANLRRRDIGKHGSGRARGLRQCVERHATDGLRPLT